MFLLPVVTASITIVKQQYIFKIFSKCVRYRVFNENIHFNKSKMHEVVKETLRILTEAIKSQK